MGDVAPAHAADQGEECAAQGSQDLGCIASTRLIAIFHHVRITHVMHSVLNGPVSTPEDFDLSDIRLVTGQADTVPDLL